MRAADLGLASQAGRQAGRQLLLCPEHAPGTRNSFVLMDWAWGPA